MKSSLFCFVIVTLALAVRQVQAWGEDSSVSNMVEVLSFAKEVADDYGNGKRFIAPESFFRLAVELTDRSHRAEGIYEMKPLSPEPVCTGEPTSSLDLATIGHHNNFTKALPYDFTPRSEKHEMKPPSISSSEMFDRLFLRQEKMKTEDKFGLNFLWVSWVNFYFEDSLRTKKETSGATRMDESTGMSNLAMVYGRNKEREIILRSFENGKLRTSVNYNGEEMALLWSDVVGDTTNSTDRKDYALFVLGDDGLNDHWGHVFWHTMYALEHNRICDELMAASPKKTFDDERLFRMARVIMTHRHARVFLENFASDVVLRANQINARIPAEINFCTSPEYADLRRREPRIHQEYLHAYTFHELIPDVIDYGPAAGRKSLVGEMFRNMDGYFDQSIQSHFDAFYRSAAGTFDAQNIPGYLKFATMKQIEDSRSNGVGSYIQYNDFFGGHPIKSFDDLGHNEYTKGVLKEIYDSVEDVEYYVGTLLEASFLTDNHGPSRPLVRTSMILSNVIPNFVHMSCYQDPYLYSEEFLTAKGVELIEGPVDALVSILEHHVALEDGTPFTRFDEEIEYQPEYGIADFHLRNVADFVGLNELWYHTLRNSSEHQYMYTAVVVAAMICVLLYSLSGPYIRRYIGRVREDEVSNPDVDPLTSHYALMFGMLVVQTPVYTVIMIFLYFSQRADLALEKLWFATAFMASIHLVMYVADIAARPSVKWFLWAHHIFWLLFFLIPPVFRDIFTLKVGLILDYFIVFEGGLYWVLFWSKVQNRKFSPRARLIGRWCVYVYGYSRLIQLSLLAVLFAKGFARMKENGRFALYFIVLFLALGVQMSQLHVLKVFLSWRSLFGSPKEVEEEENFHKEPPVKPPKAAALDTTTCHTRRSIADGDTATAGFSAEMSCDDLDSSTHSSQRSNSTSDPLKAYEEQFLFDFEESVQFGDLEASIRVADLEHHIAELKEQGVDLEDPKSWDESSASTMDA